MRREWLGDTFDHIKGAVIATCEESVAKDVHVLPMITDTPPWAATDPAWDCYGWVVRRGAGLFLNKDKPFAFLRDDTLSLRERYDRWLATRADYFAGLKDFEGDLFLDPDKVLVILLRFLGAGGLFALVAVFMPVSWSGCSFSAQSKAA